MNDAAADLDCAQARRLVGLRHDNELDPLDSIRIERHLESCGPCGTRARALALLGSALRDRSLVFEPPAAFAPRLPASSRARGLRPVLPIAASFLVGSLLTVGALRIVSLSGSSERSVARDIVAAEIRASFPGHLIDVVSSDRHTVKPWFSGKLDYSPPVVDLADEGFPLVGGRLDYAGGRTVAVLVYRRRQHAINVFLWPSEGRSDIAASSESGFHLLHWRRGGMAFWVASDLDPAELRRFAALLADRPGPGLSPPSDPSRSPE